MSVRQDELPLEGREGQTLLVEGKCSIRPNSRVSLTRSIFTEEIFLCFSAVAQFNALVLITSSGGSAFDIEATHILWANSERMGSKKERSTPKNLSEHKDIFIRVMTEQGESLLSLVRKS